MKSIVAFLGLIVLFVEIVVSPIFHRTRYWKDREERKTQEFNEKYPEFKHYFEDDPLTNLFRNISKFFKGFM